MWTTSDPNQIASAWQQLNSHKSINTNSWTHQDDNTFLNNYNTGNIDKSQYEIHGEMVSIAPPSPPAAPNVSNTHNNDLSGNNFYILFDTRQHLELYLSSVSWSNKEKFFYLLANGMALLGPWNDATIGRTSPRYAERFRIINNHGYVKIILANISIGYLVNYFAHTHPDDNIGEPSTEDGYIYNYFHQWGIPTLIYFHEKYWLHTTYPGKTINPK